MKSLYSRDSSFKQSIDSSGWNLLQRPPDSSVEPARGTVSLEHNYIYTVAVRRHRKGDKGLNELGSVTCIFFYNFVFVHMQYAPFSKCTGGVARGLIILKPSKKERTGELIDIWPCFQIPNNKCVDQTARMCRLVCAFVVRKQQSLFFASWPICC